MKKILTLFLLFCFNDSFSQPGYNSMMHTYQQNYVKNHEIVPEKDKKYFSFFPVNAEYNITAQFKSINDTTGFMMKTSGKKSSRYFKYGKLSFKLKDTTLLLYIYRSEELSKTEEYKDHLFIPFTDRTSGEESYGGGRYLDLTMGMIRDNTLQIDFNRAYNPYCMYAKGFNCPLPPRENDLPVSVMAGEKLFSLAE